MFPVHGCGLSGSISVAACRTDTNRSKKTGNMMADIIKTLKQNAHGIFSKYPVLFAYAYGSMVSGTAHRFSDLDIGIYLRPDCLGNALETELNLSLDIDRQLGHVIETEVRAVNTLPITFVGRILTEGVLLYSADESRRVAFEVLLRKKYFDFLPIIRNHRRAYIESAKQERNNHG